MEKWQAVKEDFGHFLASLVSMIAMVYTVVQAYLGFLRQEHNQYVFNIEVLLFILLSYQLFLVIKYGSEIVQKLKK